MKTKLLNNLKYKGHIEKCREKTGSEETFQVSILK